MIKLNAALTAVAPDVDQQIWSPVLIGAFVRWGLTTDRHIAAALGQFVVEAGTNFGELTENLNYTHAERLEQIFSGYFHTLEAAQNYVGQPEALANLVYSRRLGNGPVESGDGWRFRGRGLIQLTGRDEYTSAATAFGKSVDRMAEWTATPEGAAQTGCWYLASRNCLPWAEAWEIDRITRAVNGSAMVNRVGRLDASNTALSAMSAVA
jgi:putative chitinase